MCYFKYSPFVNSCICTSEYSIALDIIDTWPILSKYNAQGMDCRTVHRLPQQSLRQYCSVWLICACVACKTQLLPICSLGCKSLSDNWNRFKSSYVWYFTSGINFISTDTIICTKITISNIGYKWMYQSTRVQLSQELIVDKNHSPDV